MNTVLWILVSLLALIGAAEILGRWYFSRKPRRFANGNYRLITLYDDPVQVEAALNHQLLRLSWFGPESLLLFVDMGMGSRSLEVCEKILPEMYNVFLCDRRDLADTLRQLDILTEAGKL